MKKTLTLILGIVLVVLILFFGIYKFAESISPGINVYSEDYTINASDSTLLLTILGFKEEHPEYKVPEYLKLVDGPPEDPFFKFHTDIYFYFPVENEILYTTVRKITAKKTKFSLVRINQGLILGNWKDINRDFDNSEKALKKRKFEERILKKVKEELEVQ